VPAEQVEQDVEPAADEIEPAAQLTHVLLPAALYLPATHKVHDDDPVVDAYLPASH